MNRLKNYIEKLILGVGCLTLLGSCRDFPIFSSDSELLAKVGDNELYLNDIQSIFTQGMQAEDSIKLQNSYVDMWVKKQLKLQIAEKEVSGQQSDIDKMVDEYRNSLVIFKYEQQLVETKMDTAVTESQISDYYLANINDFSLGNPIIKGTVVAIPRDYRQEKNIVELIKSKKQDDYYDLVEICNKNSFDLYEFNTWTDISNVLYVLPVNTDKILSEYVKSSATEKMVSSKDFYEFGDNDNKYFLKIIDYKLIGEHSPIELVAPAIRKIIFNKRKYDLIKNIEDSVYNQAIINKDITVSINTNKE